MKVFAGDLRVRPVAGQAFLEILGHLLTVGVVLIEQVDLFDLRLILHERSQGLHFHGGVCIKPEMRERAFLVGQRRIDRCVVQINHFLARVALIVLGNCIGKRKCHGRSIALCDIPNSLVDGRLQPVQGFLR